MQHRFLRHTGLFAIPLTLLSILSLAGVGSETEAADFFWIPFTALILAGILAIPTTLITRYYDKWRESRIQE